MCYRKSVPGNEALEQKFKAKYFGEPFKKIYNVSPFTQTKLLVITDEKPEEI